MQGLNESEPQLEGNGAGKTSLWEALTWCIQGKTSKGLKAGDVGNWEAGKGTVVEFDFISPSGEECTLVRTWKPNSWLLRSTGDPKDVEDLDKAERNAFMGWLGLDYSPWLNCVLMAQNQPMFLDLKAEAKAMLFSDVLGLDKWMEASANASKAASREDAEIRRMERREAEIRGELEALGNSDFKASREEWERKRGERLDALVGEYNEILKHSSVKEDLKAAQEKADAKRAAYRTINEPIKEIEERLEGERREMRRLEIRAAEMRRDAEHAVEHLESMMKQGMCSTCGQPVEKLSEAALKKLEAKAQAIKDEAEETLAAMKKHKAKVEDWEDRLDEVLDGLDDARKAMHRADDDLVACRQRKLEEDKRLDRLEDDADDLRKEVNPFDVMAEKAEARQNRLSREGRELGRGLDEARHRHSIYSYWVRGFKEIRLQQISEALVELEIEVNSAVASLGLIDWRLEFAVDRETAKGTMQRGFNVLVVSPHNAKAVPWEAWSGGEAQRLRLAGNMGLADLIRSRTGTGFMLETYDEPTQGLSPRGVDDLLESLAQRSKTEGRPIWIVDHRSHSFGGFSGGATIIKAPSGSRIRQQSV